MKYQFQVKLTRLEGEVRKYCHYEED